MELIKDWIRSERIRPQTRNAPEISVNLEDLSKRIGEKLRRFEAHVLNVHFYEDVGYPWIRVTSSETIDPRLGLEIGNAVAEEAGEDHVYFNSLQPRAISFLIELKFAAPQKIRRPASQYGEQLEVMRAAWQVRSSRSN